MGKKPEVKRVGAPDWIVTFTDLTSLLTTFFVLLLTFSTMEPQEESMNNGPQEGSPSPLGEKVSMLREWLEPPRQDSIQEEASSTPEEREESILAGSNPVSRGSLEEGCLVSFDESFNFKRGWTAPGKRLQERVTGLARQLAEDDLRVVVIGYADGREHLEQGFASAGELARRRALEVANIFLAADPAWPAHRVGVKACGSAGDRVASRRERAARRRVELYFRAAEE